MLFSGKGYTHLQHIKRDFNYIILFFTFCFFLKVDAQNKSNSGKDFWLGYGYNWIFDNENPLGEVMDLKGRNSKTPKKSNHGARPCSSVMRKLKKTGWYKKVTAYK